MGWVAGRGPEIPRSLYSAPGQAQVTDQPDQPSDRLGGPRPAAPAVRGATEARDGAGVTAEAHVPTRRTTANDVRVPTTPL